MVRERPRVQPITADGPILVAILDVLGDLHDLIDERLGKQEGPVPVAEPAPSAQPKAVPVSEPAPDLPPEKARPVEEPDPGDEPEKTLPDHPPLAGKGSSTTAWATWAHTAGVDVEDGATRDDIITACRNAGVIE